MTDITPVLVERVEAAVRATPGVRDLYRSGSLVSNLVGAGAVALGLRAGGEPVVVVSPEGSGVRVEASLGIDFLPGARETLRAVRAAVVEALSEEGITLSSIALTVAYVHSRENSA
ncbi:hypothetical protein AUC47_13820 [Microbacterium sp. SZ1]|uniref:hypothetical protein n=1 Tax=Microbacterium sp. SZ1 TaxID=1849736 RepID=UPI000BBC9C26|nr:hypothetical protein [Microbacterium sp. SZ1]PCE15376.1 hypothetical protein AUC47_13820 [Microbacterium sp. SZ1]